MFVIVTYKYGCPIKHDELFLPTHTNKKGGWVDSYSLDKLLFIIFVTLFIFLT